MYYSAESSATERRNVSFVVFSVTFLATLIAFVFIWMQIRKIRPSVIADMEANRLQLELSKSRNSEEDPESGSDVIEMVDVDCKTGFTTPPIGLDHRASFIHRDSSLGLGQNSPSMPHLPLDREAFDQDYFGRGSIPSEAQLATRRKSLH